MVTLIYFGLVIIAHCEKFYYHDKGSNKNTQLSSGFEAFKLMISAFDMFYNGNINILHNQIKDNENE